MEKGGKVFASILLVNVIQDLRVFKMKALHIQKITGRSLHFGKVLHAVSYNIIFISTMTSNFTQDEKDENIDEYDHKVEAHLLMEIAKLTRIARVLKFNLKTLIEGIKTQSIIPLPCPVTTNGCETTSLDAFAYTWEDPKNCIFSFEQMMIRIKNLTL